MKPRAYKERKILEEWWEKAREQGIIEDSNSTWRNSIFPVPKAVSFNTAGEPVQKWRIVTPFFGLNKLLNIRATLMPRLIDNMVTIANRKQYTALLLGFSISSSILQGELMKILKELYFKYVICYADDIWINSDGSKEHHIRIVKKVIELLEKAIVKLKATKVEIGKEQVSFLGMRVSAEGWKISKKFTQSVVEAKEPTLRKEVRSFIGLCSWQRRFIHKLAQAKTAIH